MRSNLIIEVIKDYMASDANSLQAMVLYGEWGSGKTHFCEHELKDVLEEIGVKICRASLFGVSDQEEIFNRVIASRAHLFESSAEGISAVTNLLKKGVLDVGSSMISNKLAEAGIHVSFKSDLLLPLINMKNVLIIFDDCERNAFVNDDKAFFGVVNNMVENYGWHILLVMNKPLSFGINGSVEKAVIRQIEFEADLYTLYKVIVDPKLDIPSQIDFDVKKAIIQGLEGSHVNARALARSIPAISYVLNSRFLRESPISLDGRIHAFSDFVGYAVRASAGRVLERPSNSSGPVNHNDNFESLEYEYYSYLAMALVPLTEGRDVNPEIVESSFSEYAIKKYPDSAADIQAQNLETQWRMMSSLEDEEVKLLADDLEKVLSEGQYSHSWFYKIVQIALELINLGFWDKTYREKLLNSLKRAADRDSRCNAALLKQLISMSGGLYGQDADLILNELVSSIELKEKERDLSRIKVEFSSIDCKTGESLAAFLQEAVKTGCSSRILSVPSSFVAKSIYEGSARSQLALHSFFRTNLINISGGQNLNGFAAWLEDIGTRLAGLGCKSHMGELRSKWIQEDIKLAIEEFKRRM